jgi:hypothetical protein
MPLINLSTQYNFYCIARPTTVIADHLHKYRREMGVVFVYYFLFLKIFLLLILIRLLIMEIRNK